MISGNSDREMMSLATDGDWTTGLRLTVYLPWTLNIWLIESLSVLKLLISHKHSKFSKQLVVFVIFSGWGRPIFENMNVQWI